MKKIFIFLMCMFCTAISMTAQQSTENYAGSSKFVDNWSVGVYGGVNTNLHTWNAPQGGDFGIELSRQITPIWGFTLQAQAGVNDLMNYQGHSSHVHNGVVIDNVAAFVLGTFNFSNAFFGYNGKPRVFEVVGVAGVGYGHGFDSQYSTQSTAVSYKDALLTKAGLNFDFNIGKLKAWTISLRPSVTFNTSAHGAYCASHSAFNADAAVIYHFRTSNGTHYINKAKLYDQHEIDCLNEQINNLKQLTDERAIENDSLKSIITKLQSENEASAQQAEEVANVLYAPVKFAKASAKITDSKSLDDLAELIKKTGKKVDILGYASVEGSAKFNQKLSEQRAMAVKQALRQRGCASLLGRAQGMGSTDKFSANSLDANRVVILLK